MSKSCFKNQWALVTGASSGIGVEFARQIAAKGGNVVLVARTESKLVALADKLSAEFGVQAEVLAMDLSAPGASERVGAIVEERNLSIDHLINNAGFGDGTHYESSQLSRTRDMIAVNCTAVAELTRVLLPPMISRRGGGVLTVASLVGFTPMPYMTVYAATKAFAKHFSLALGFELKGTGVRCMAVCPGRVPTQFESAAGFAAPRGYVPGQLSAEQTARMALSRYEGRRSLLIPGFANVMLAFLARLVPGSWMANIMGNGVKSTMNLGED